MWRPRIRPRRRRLAGRLAAVSVLALAAWLALPPTVSHAHATLLSSTPRAGEQLGIAPGVVVLRFSQPLEPKLSKVTVTDPAATRAAGKLSGTEARVELAGSQPGRYRVEWNAVSTDDGHTVRGAFEFTVAAPADRTRQPASTQGVDRLTASFRAVQYAALLLVVGMLLIGQLAHGMPKPTWVRMRLGLPLTVALASGLAVLLREADAAASGQVGTYLASGPAAWGRVALVAAEAAALVGALAWRPLLAAAMPTALVALAASGHAATVRPAWWGIALDAGHLAGAGLWAGGILALATLRPPGGWRGPAGRRLLDRFSPVALGAFAATVTLGGVQAWQRLGGPGALLGTPYGRTLAVKLALVGLMVPLSLLAWRRRLVTRAEAWLVLGVVSLAGLLAVSTLPTRPEATAAGTEQSSSALPRDGDLTLGEPAGKVLVGLTIRPARPGPNQLLVHLLPLEGEQAAARLQVALDLSRRGGRGASTTIVPQPCGPACRQTTATLRGGETIRALVAGPDGGTASFQLPALPAPDGRRVLARSQQRMHTLGSVTLDETLSWGPAQTRSRYRLQAPDRMRIQTNGTETIIIGATRYSRDRAGQPWQAEGFPPTRQPAYVWDFYTPPVATRVLGTRRLDGRPIRIVAFFGGTGRLPVWFRLWVDPDGLVRHAEMFTQGHFMIHDYSNFNQGTTIVPPTR